MVLKGEELPQMEDVEEARTLDKGPCAGFETS